MATKNKSAGGVETDYAGQPLKEGVGYVRLTRGRKAGRLAAPDQVINLLDNQTCLGSDPYLTALDGACLAYEDLQALGYVECATGGLAPRNDCVEVVTYVDPWGDQSRGYVYLFSVYYADVVRSIEDDVSFLSATVAGGAGYRQRDGDWVRVDEEESSGQPLLGRYGAYQHPDRISTRTRYTIGFEVEKEDAAVRDEFNADRLFTDTGWAMERDGSLNSEGYELISPVYDLDDDQLDEALTHSGIARLVNGSYSERCGGHINIGERGHSGMAFFDSYVRAWLPLLYALYRSRIKHNYCKGKSSGELKTDREKYQSVRIQNAYVELRIVSAVRSVDNLLWRRDLMRLMVTHKAASPTAVVRMMLMQEHALHQHLRKVYSEKALLERADETMAHALNFEGIVAHALGERIKEALKDGTVPSSLPTSDPEPFGYDFSGRALYSGTEVLTLTGGQNRGGLIAAADKRLIRCQDGALLTQRDNFCTISQPGWGPSQLLYFATRAAAEKAGWVPDSEGGYWLRKEEAMRVASNGGLDPNCYEWVKRGKHRPYCRELGLYFKSASHLRDNFSSAQPDKHGIVLVSSDLRRHAQHYGLKPTTQNGPDPDSFFVPPPGGRPAPWEAGPAVPPAAVPATA